ncbi:MAG: serine/threonine protein kinase [Bryobacteraceae bacterium]|nr:serine/threonine protein kinase [Bryobacteraceae bacterium]
MPLQAGNRVGPYEIISLLGVGGMGEVYRANDTAQGRQVALKVLPDALARDSERLTRFTREAHVLASLNHPNIAAIYGIEGPAIVMELVEGRDLTVPLPLDEALPIARQIAEALEAAHDKGVVHRDLKPANIKITPDGVVKVLDFGLATAPVAKSGADSANSPTLTIASQPGVIMGTAGYRSPEQASGRPVDRRSDIWSYGVVLYELLCGRRLFQGETLMQTLAEVVRGDVNLTTLPSSTPPVIRELLRRCLDRNVKTRLRDRCGSLRRREDHSSAKVAATSVVLNGKPGGIDTGKPGVGAASPKSRPNRTRCSATSRVSRDSSDERRILGSEGGGPSPPSFSRLPTAVVSYCKVMAVCSTAGEMRGRSVFPRTSVCPRTSVSLLTTTNSIECEHA